MADTVRPGLVRALTRWDLTALVINSILGSGIFGLPATIILLLHGASPLAYLVAGAGIAVVVVCFAEVSSRFTQAGGPYLYAREAFGPFIGLQIGWIAWLVRVTSAGANANLFALYLAELWPPAGNPLGRAMVLTLLILVLSYVNYRGVKQGAWASDALALHREVLLAYGGAKRWVGRPRDGEQAANEAAIAHVFVKSEGGRWFWLQHELVSRGALVSVTSRLSSSELALGSKPLDMA